MEPPIRSRGWLFMGLLSLQFSVQPLLTRACISRHANKVLLVLLCELTKALLCAFLLLASGRQERPSRAWRASESLVQGLVPSCVYSLQNVVIQIGYQHTSALLFNLLNQTKVIFTAVMIYIFIGTRPSPMQALALLMVLIAGVILSLPLSEGEASIDFGETRIEFWYGIAPTLLASLLSGFATAWTQRVLTRGAQRNPNSFTLELSMYSTMLLLGNMLWDNKGSLAMVASEAHLLVLNNPWCWIPIMTNSLGGIIAGQVIKHVGGVRRTFAVITGIMLTGFFEWLAYGVQLSPRVWVCLPMVILAIGMYSVTPAQYQKAKSQ